MSFNKQYHIHYILRLAIAMCFIGHGVFGIITKAVWCNYFAVFGIEKTFAYRLMPVVGGFDIILGLIMLFYPVRIIPAWLVFWGILTASLRPLSGEPLAELIERAGNYGAPLALLLLSGISGEAKSWFARIQPAARVNDATLASITDCLKITVFLLFLGHGWLNVIGKAALLKQYAGLGFSSPAQVAQIIGVSEIVTAILVLIKPLRPVLFILFIWKMGTELLYPNYGLFEWLERGGSYGAILALWVMTKKQLMINHRVQKIRLAREQTFSA